MPEETVTAAHGNRRRILFLIDGLEGDGAERQFCELVKGVHDLQEFEAHVGVLEERDSGHAWLLESLGLRINGFTRKSRFDLSPLRAIIRYIREHDVDLVHAYMSMGSEFGLIAGRFCGIPVITSSIRNARNRNWREAIRTYYQARFADLAVANSRAGFSSRFRRMRSSFRVIHNGIDPERVSVSEGDRNELRRELGLHDGVRLITMAARMTPQKDHRTLLEALRRVLLSQSDVLLLLAGEGPLEAEISDLAHRLGIARHVRFLGHRRDVERLLAICDVSILLTSSDIHLEGISNTIIESMSIGTPVVATRGGGTDEILADDDLGPPPYTHGIKVEPYRPDQVADAIRYYLEDDAERLRIASAARSMALERFGFGRYVRENVLLYRELIGGASPAGAAAGAA